MNKIKEHEIINTLHWELSSVVPKTDGEIYVSMSIDKYIITATCFLHCAKEGRVVGNIESEVFIWKIIIEKISMLKWYKKKDNFFSQSLSHPVVFYKTELKFLKQLWQLFLAMMWLAALCNIWCYWHWNTANTTLDIYLFFIKRSKNNSNNVYNFFKPTKCATITDFRLGSDFYKPWTPSMPYSNVTIQTLKN